MIFYSDFWLQTSDFFSGRKGKGVMGKWKMKKRVKKICGKERINLDLLGKDDVSANTYLIRFMKGITRPEKHLSTG